jgi:hypothetical protein
MSETLNDRVRKVIGGVSEGFPGKFQEEPPGFRRMNGSIRIVPMRLPFTRATRNGIGTGGFHGLF